MCLCNKLYLRILNIISYLKRLFLFNMKLIKSRKAPTNLVLHNIKRFGKVSLQVKQKRKVSSKSQKKFTKKKSRGGKLRSKSKNKKSRK